MLATVYIIFLMPLFAARLLVRVLINMMYNVRTVGGENIPETGPALLVSNHLSLMDGFLVGWAARRRVVRFMLWKPYYDHKIFGWFLRALRCIPVDLRGPRGMARAMQDARKALEQGDVVCVFAEGSVTRTGHMLPFKRGMEKILKGIEDKGVKVPVIPMALDRVWGGFVSFAGGEFGSKRPEFRRPITVKIGTALPASVTALETRQVISELAADAFALRKSPSETLPMRFVKMAKRKWGRFCMADTMGKELTYGRTLTAAIILAGEVNKRCANDKMVGLLLPSTVGGALANLGVALTGKTAVNLNFTAGKEVMEHCIEQCEIRTVLTSKTFLDKAKLEAPRGAVYLEDILKGVSGVTKLLALLKARLAPAWMIAPRVSPDDTAAIIFSSGSTGVPKGVMLSHFNVVANIDGVLGVFNLSEEDRILGILPFFHSFGFMATIWLPLLAGCGVAYHPVPTDAKAVGELVEKFKGTFLLSTPTFCQAYVRKCTPEQFATLRYVVVGAEKLREPLRQQFQEKFGKELLEGYGCTEMAPVVAVNTPDFEHPREHQVGTKHGTIGLPLPGVATKVIDPETEEELPLGEAGMLLVKGPNRMQGYLKQPEKTAEVFRGDWYVTGDIAALDEDGFITITDRLSRFSKIGGEMVPHLKIEEAITASFADQECGCAVTGVPDERKGERLAVLYTNPDLRPDEIWQRLSATDLPKLWIPKSDCILKVDALPVLGTGKLDLRGLKRMAEEKLGVTTAKQ